MIKKLIGLIFFVCILLGFCYVLFDIKPNTFGYDILATDKKSGKVHIGLRYKKEFMVHIFKVKTVGDSVGRVIDQWREKQENQE